MSGTGGMRWLAWLIAGPSVWAVAFSAAYGLHGLGCERGWSALYLGPVSAQRAAILLVGLVAALVCMALLAQVDRRLGAAALLPRLGIWIGLSATLFTLAPVLVALLTCPIASPQWRGMTMRHCRRDPATPSCVAFSPPPASCSPLPARRTGCCPWAGMRSTW